MPTIYCLGMATHHPLSHVAIDDYSAVSHDIHMSSTWCQSDICRYNRIQKEAPENVSKPFPSLEVWGRDYMYHVYLEREGGADKKYDKQGG